MNGTYFADYVQKDLLLSIMMRTVNSELTVLKQKLLPNCQSNQMVHI